MKFTLAIVAILAVASPLYAFKIPSTGSGELAKELQDILDLVPLDKIIKLIKQYIAEDKEVQTVMKVLQSPEVQLYVKDVEAAPEAKKLLNYVQNAGVDIYTIVNIVNKSLGLAPIVPLDLSEYKITGGINGLNQDIVDLLPMKQITNVIQTKMIKSKVFADFVRLMISPENLSFIASLRTNTHYVNLLTEATKAGLNQREIENTIDVFIVIKVIVSRH
ncbi:protein G12-like [Calliopsis andreniformis]|uniref:protein G12-like n=1 Tax=Calliopsis andreniformis TaxID=337506 RepID=UPI003FCE5B3E